MEQSSPFIHHRSKRQGAPPTKGGTAVSKAELLKTATGDGKKKKKEKEKKTPLLLVPRKTARNVLVPFQPSVRHEE
jgi:hypothetical protein